MPDHHAVSLFMPIFVIKKQHHIMKKILYITCLLACWTLCCAPVMAQVNNGANATNVKKQAKVRIQTPMGDIVVRLYDETPLHRDNFLKLVREGFYDGTLFHRVIKDFMIQGGDPASKDAPADKLLGGGGPGYEIAAEIKDGMYHKRGALAAARQGDNVNPERKSSGSQFYIVYGQVFNDEELKLFEQQQRKKKVQEAFHQLAEEHRSEIAQLRRDRNTAGLERLQSRLAEEAEKNVPLTGLSDEQKRIYSTIGGTPHLDGQYTVFGEVVEGLDVVEKIQTVATGTANRPQEDIKMKMTIIE